MKTPYLLALTTLVAGCSQEPNYEFKTVAGGGVVWRFNHRTGEVDYSTVQSGCWQRIAPQRITEELLGRAINHDYNFEEPTKPQKSK